jgi:Ca2+-binding RTX toxin-like protein
MTIQIFQSDSVGNGVRAALGELDSMYVAQDAVVGREDAASWSDCTVEGTGSEHVVRTDGTIVGNIMLGDDTNDYSNTVEIGKTGAIQSLLDPVAALYIKGKWATVENTGTISSSGTGIMLQLSSGSGATNIVNDGTIDVDNSAVTRSSGTESINIENNGVMRGNYALVSNNYGIDTFVNNGTIDAAILFGGGDDIYDGRAGTITGTVSGEQGQDTLIGGAGAELFHGGDQNDSLRGNGGNDRMWGENGDDIIVGDGGNDSLYGGEGGDDLYGGVGADRFWGDNGDDEMFGDAGNDEMFGGVGNDVLSGGLGRDSMFGEAGADTFRFTAKTHSVVGANADRIGDFDDFGNDTIDVSALFGPALTFIGTKDFTKAGQLHIKDVAGPDVLVEVNTGGSLAADFQIRLVDTTVASMTKNDFVL